MSASVTFELVSPEKLLLSTQAAQVVIPGEEGDFGVLAGHAPVMSTVRPGIVSVFEEGKSDAIKLFVGGGFAEVADDRVTILAEDALPLAEADAAQVAQDLANAREDLSDAKTDHDRQVIAARVKRLEALSAAITA